RSYAVRSIGFARAQVLFRHARTSLRVHAGGKVRVVADGRIVIGDRVFFLAGMEPTELVCASGAELVIGDRTGFNYGVSIQCTRNIRIGKDCKFGSRVVVRDSSASSAGAVVIEDSVWLAYGV